MSEPRGPEEHERTWRSALRLRQLDHDVLGVRRPRAEALVPGAHVLELRPLDVERVPAIDEAADRDVAHGEVLAADIVAAVQPAVEPAEEAAGILGRLLDRGHVALLGRRADQAPEADAHGLGDRAELPVHPAVGVAPLARIVGPQGAG